jgi:serine/threonine-protein kinase
MVLLFGVGYLISAEWLFPASGPEAAADEVVEVPDMVGLDEADARAALADAGLELRVRSEMPHRDAPEGAVVAQSPLPGQLARPGAPVEATLSEGPRRRTVPDLRGLSGRQAQIVLERLGFSASVDTASSDVERGRVVGTRPEAGSDRSLPSEVRVVVSRGPEVSDVPELVGVHVDDVEERLRERGFRLGEVTYDPEAFSAPGRVIGQTPAPGYALREGGRVSVRVAGSAPDPTAGGPPADSAPSGGAFPDSLP